MTSLRARLAAGTALAVTLVLVVAGGTLSLLVERRLVAEVDRSLVARAQLLASAVEVEGLRVEIEFEELDVSGLRAGGDELLEVWHGEQSLYRSKSLGDTSLDRSATLSGGWTSHPRGTAARVVGLRFRPRREGRSGQSPELFLALARDASGVKEAVATLQGLLLVVGLATVGIVWAVLAVVVGRSLRPLEALSAEVAGIGQETLATRLEPGRVPAELVPVVERVNELLARLEVAFARERSFSDDVAHELRTPLAGLRATLEVAEARPRSPADYAAALRTGADLAAQLQGLVDRLLQLARLEGRTRAFEARPCDLADASLEAWEPLAGEAQARELTVAWQLEPGLEAEADPDLLGLILRNLFENAVHYADGGGRVRVHTADASGAVAVTVANTGSRLSDSQARQATARFWRGDDARREAGLHCGLGLSLVERAAVALGGRLELRSTAGGEFSATVVLPGGPGAPAPDAGARVAAEVG